MLLHSWFAGFLAGVAKGWGMEKCARLGGAVGALCVGQIGATAGLRGWDETIGFMDTCPSIHITA